jgi:hypothetical protein
MQIEPTAGKAPLVQYWKGGVAKNNEAIKALFLYTLFQNSSGPLTEFNFCSAI